ncbi:hypothetical protein OEZ86_007333 [Tetradesmus obliquus]|nr:hypothetical protein OEZ86_007333 [Tetradesmus obliquus]
MSIGKRSFVDFAAGSEPNLTLITADGGRIPAHYDVLRLVCSCLRNAPASDTWDLSSLLVNGSPVSQSTVTAVLEVIYSNLGALDHGEDCTSGQYSLAQLLDMLLFADAVGCSKAVQGQLAGLLGNCVEPKLQNGSCDGAAAFNETYCFGRLGESDDRSGDSTDEDDDADYLRLQRLEGEDVTDMLQLTEQQKQQMKKQVQQQLEALLFVGFKLDLQQLLEPGLRFLRNNAADGPSYSLMGDAAVEGILSQRVLAATNGASGAELLSRACLQLPLGLGYGVGSMFGDVRYHRAGERGYVEFAATLLQDFYEYRKGAKVEVVFDRKGNVTVKNEGDERADGGQNWRFSVVLGPKCAFGKRL